MSEFVRKLRDDELKLLREKLHEEWLGYRGTKHARFALDRLLVVDEEYNERERLKLCRGLTK